jgi:putative membrane protein
MLKVMPITGTLLAMLVAAPGAVGQVTSSQDTAKSPWPTVNRGTTFGDGVSADSSFIRQAIRGNYTEVALGRLAGSRASNSEVKDFAERMVEDHNSMNKAWIDLAQDNDMKVTMDFGEPGRQAIDRLEKLSGTAFDQAYMSEMIREHEQDLSAFQRMATSARSSQVQQLASSGASTIRQHLTAAQQVGSRVGVSSTAGRAGGVPLPSDNANDRNESKALEAGDRKFVQNVLQDHLMHIRLAERAKREANDQETRRLAERLEKDFTQWQERWENLAARHDLKAPSHLGQLHAKKIEILEETSKGDYDRMYASIVASHLESVVPYFQKEGQAVGAADVRRLVDDELPMIRENLAKAERLMGLAKDEDRQKSSDRK